MAYRILTDTGCDLPFEQYKQLDVDLVKLTVDYKGESIQEYTESWLKEMFDGLRAGETAQTSAVNPDTWHSAMEPTLQRGEDVLTLVFSSGLSTTYQSAVIAAQELQEKYPQRKVIVVDTLCAALGQGLLVWYTCKKRDEGLSLEELAAWVEDNKLHLAHWFTVDDLVYLKRGGRVSAATAVVGAMLNIKPVLRVDDEGHLISASKVRGRKSAVKALADKLDEATGFANSTVFICHADCMNDAQLLKSMVLEKHPGVDVMIGNLGAVIGSHAGPGTLALFFMDKQR